MVHVSWCGSTAHLWMWTQIEWVNLSVFSAKSLGLTSSMWQPMGLKKVPGKSNLNQTFHFLLKGANPLVGRVVIVIVWNVFSMLGFLRPADVSLNPNLTYHKIGSDPKVKTTILRKFQQTPWNTRYPKIQIWKDFLRKQVVEGLGYAPGVCRSFLRTMATTSLKSNIPK